MLSLSSGRVNDEYRAGGNRHGPLNTRWSNTLGLLRINDAAPTDNMNVMVQEQK
jgi:hypothetical protein